MNADLPVSHPAEVGRDEPQTDEITPYSPSRKIGGGFVLSVVIGGCVGRARGHRPYTLLAFERVIASRTPLVFLVLFVAPRAFCGSCAFCGSPRLTESKICRLISEKRFGPLADTFRAML